MHEPIKRKHTQLDDNKISSTDLLDLLTGLLMQRSVNLTPTVFVKILALTIETNLSVDLVPEIFAKKSA